MLLNYMFILNYLIYFFERIFMKKIFLILNERFINFFFINVNFVFVFYLKLKIWRVRVECSKK